MAVVVHLRTDRGHLVVLPSRYSEAAQTLFIVKPGMMTEARACHTKVSTTATPTRVVLPGLSPWAFRNDGGQDSQGQSGHEVFSMTA